MRYTSLVLAFGMSMAVSAKAWSQTTIQVKWAGSPHVYELTFTGGMGNSGGLKYTNVSPNLASPETKLLVVGRPAVVPFINGNPSEYRGIPSLNSDPKALAHVMVNSAAQVVYLNKQGLSFVFPEMFGDGSEFAFRSLGHENVIVQFKARSSGQLKTYVFIDGRLSEVPNISEAFKKPELRGDSLIIDGKEIGEVRNFAALESPRAFKGITSITLKEYAASSAAVIEQARRERIGSGNSVASTDVKPAGQQKDTAAKASGAQGSTRPGRLTGEEIAKAQGRQHPSEFDITVTNNDGEEVSAWDLVSTFAVDAHEKYQGTEYFLDPELRKREDALLEALLGVEISSAKFLAEAGSGKSALFRNLMARVAKGDIPDELKAYTFIEVTPSQMSGTKWANSGGNNATAVLKICEEGKVIVIVDEAHQLATAGTNGESGTGGATEIWKPALANGGMKAIMISTPGEWEHAYAKNPAWDSRFQLVMGGEPPKDQLIGIVQNWGKTRKNADLSREVAELIVQYSNRYDAMGAQPRRSVRLMEKVFASKAMNKDTSPVSIDNVKVAAQRLYQLPHTLFDHTLMRNMIREMRTKFSEQFVGQEQTINELIFGEGEILTGANDTSKPGHLALLAGPAGQGMDLAMQIYSEGTGRKLYKIAGSDFQSKDDVDKFRRKIGEAFQNTGFVALYFDKVDLMHADVRQVLKKLVEDGRIGVPTGSASNPTIVTVNARNSSVFMSTNAGSQYVSSLASKAEFDDDRIRNELIEEGFDRSLLESAGVKVLPFFRLDIMEFKKVVKLRLERILNSYKTSESPIVIDFKDADAFAEATAKQFWSPQMNTAQAVQRIDAQLRRQVSMAILEGDGSRSLKVSYKDGKLETTTAPAAGSGGATSGAGSKCVDAVTPDKTPKKK